MLALSIKLIAFYFDKYFLNVISFNFSVRYIDDVLSLNNSRFGNFVDRIYPIGLEIKDTTYTDKSASYLDLHLSSCSTSGTRRFNLATNPVISRE
jgi:hypothetical protein